MFHVKPVPDSIVVTAIPPRYNSSMSHTMDTPMLQERIVIDTHICHGKPVVRGTRTPVSVILGHIAGGDTFDAVEREYGVTSEDIRACVAFANDKLSRSTFVPAVQSH
jgi:uncharacterized protein (DUF433 family)